MITVTASLVLHHPSPRWHPHHWWHYRLSETFSQIEHDDTRTVFSDLVVAHVPEVIDPGAMTTRLMPATDDGEPLRGAEVRTLDGEVDPARAVHWWLQRCAIPHQPHGELDPGRP